MYGFVKISHSFSLKMIISIHAQQKLYNFDPPVEYLQVVLKQDETSWKEEEEKKGVGVLSCQLSNEAFFDQISFMCV